MSPHLQEKRNPRISAAHALAVLRLELGKRKQQSAAGKRATYKPDCTPPGKLPAKSADYELTGT